MTTQLPEEPIAQQMYPLYTHLLGMRSRLGWLNVVDMQKNSPAVDALTPQSTASMYRLRIAGAIPDGWEQRLGCLRVARQETPERGPETTLMGAVTDQAELLGVLNALHALHLPLLLVEAIDPESIHT